MGKVKVVSKNNQVSVKVKSTKDEQLNQNMAELLSNTAVEGFLPVLKKLFSCLISRYSILCCKSIII